MKPVDLSIIIPAYMEAATIGTSLEKLADFLKSRNYGHVEVLVVVPNSTDATAAIAESKANLFEEFRIVHAGERVGKGRDVRLGMLEAKGRYRMFMDADLATPLIHLDQMWALMSRGAKVIIGVRDLLIIHKGLVRKIITKTANLVVQFLLLPGVKDTQCGFKCFEANAAEEIFRRQTLLQWSFDMEILKIARILKYKIHTINLPDWKDPKGAEGGLAGDSPLKVAIAEARDPLIVRINTWAGKYKHRHFTYEPSWVEGA